MIPTTFVLRQPHRLWNRHVLSTVTATPIPIRTCGLGSLPAQQRPRRKCSLDKPKAFCPSKTTTVSSPSTPQFWNSKSVWRRAAINTLRCLIGCTMGDFSAMWYLQAFHPEIGTEIIMGISMVAGISSSMFLESALLRFGQDRLPWIAAVKTAAGMSTISMVTMELAENAVDYHLTGGVVQLDSPAFWCAALLSVSAGFLAPLPYNYLRLRKYRKSCH